MTTIEKIRELVDAELEKITGHYHQGKVCPVCGEPAKDRCKNKLSLEKRCPEVICQNAACIEAHNARCAFKRK